MELFLARTGEHKALDSAQCNQQETAFFLFFAKGQNDLLHLLLAPVERIDKNKKANYYYVNSQHSSSERTKNTN